MKNDEKICYTRIQVPIRLNENPVDYEGRRSFFDVNCEFLKQDNCYIGDHVIEEMSIRRTEGGNEGNRFIAPEWEIEILIAEEVTEEMAGQLIRELCRAWSLAYAKNYKYFLNHGFAGFSFREMNIRRRYADERKIFGETEINRIGGYVEQRSVDVISEEIFVLPQCMLVKTTLMKDLEEAYLRALKCRDAVSRYILLYYLFEIMYATSEYQQMKENYELAHDKGQCENNKRLRANEKRGKLLYQYLIQQFGVKRYTSFDQEFDLTEDILVEIIKTRNSLTHNADTSQISKVMYRYMLPILRQVLLENRSSVGGNTEAINSEKP